MDSGNCKNLPSSRVRPNRSPSIGPATGERSNLKFFRPFQSGIMKYKTTQTKYEASNVEILGAATFIKKCYDYWISSWGWPVLSLARNKKQTQKMKAWWDVKSRCWIGTVLISSVITGRTCQCRWTEKTDRPLFPQWNFRGVKSRKNFRCCSCHVNDKTLYRSSQSATNKTNVRRHFELHLTPVQMAHWSECAYWNFNTYSFTESPPLNKRYAQSHVDQMQGGASFVTSSGMHIRGRVWHGFSTRFLYNALSMHQWRRSGNDDYSSRIMRSSEQCIFLIFEEHFYSINKRVEFSVQSYRPWFSGKN